LEKTSGWIVKTPPSTMSNLMWYDDENLSLFVVFIREDVAYVYFHVDPIWTQLFQNPPGFLGTFFNTVFKKNHKGGYSRLSPYGVGPGGGGGFQTVINYRKSGIERRKRQMQKIYQDGIVETIRKRDGFVPEGILQNLDYNDQLNKMWEDVSERSDEEFDQITTDLDEQFPEKYREIQQPIEMPEDQANVPLPNEGLELEEESLI